MWPHKLLRMLLFDEKSISNLCTVSPRIWSAYGCLSEISFSCMINLPETWWNYSKRRIFFHFSISTLWSLEEPALHYLIQNPAILSSLFKSVLCKELEYTILVCWVAVDPSDQKLHNSNFHAIVKNICLNEFFFTIMYMFLILVTLCEKLYGFQNLKMLALKKVMLQRSKIYPNTRPLRILVQLKKSHIFSNI